MINKIYMNKPMKDETDSYVQRITVGSMFYLFFIFLVFLWLCKHQKQRMKSMKKQEFTEWNNPRKDDP